MYPIQNHPQAKKWFARSGLLPRGFITVAVALFFLTIPAWSQTYLVANGTYTIAGKNSGQLVDVYNNSTTQGGLVDQWSSDGGKNQQWTLTNLGSNYVELLNVNSGMALEVAGQSLATGQANIDQWPYGGGKNQAWHVVSEGSGYYELVNENSGYALDVPGNSTTPGTDLDQWAASGTANQLWAFTAVAAPSLIANGTYTITNKNSGQAVDVYNNSTAQGGLIDQWASNGGPNQKWTLTNLGSNYVELLNVNSGMALEVAGQSLATGQANIDQWPYGGGKNQVWHVVSEGGGEYELVNENSGYALDVPGSSTTQGADLDQWAASGTANQLWAFSTTTGGGGGGSAAATVTVNRSSSGPAVTNQILGMNMVNWFDDTTSPILPAFRTAGITATRWPGGSGADVYHWQTNTQCGSGSPYSQDSWTNFLSKVVSPSSLDVAVTVNYGSNSSCNGGGDAGEAAAWVTSALNNGNRVSHWTIGNEVYGSWEEDLHSAPHDPGTYAYQVKNYYYPQMKAANSNTLIGVVAQPSDETANWDAIVLAQAKYDFIEYHFYSQAPGQENDTFLVQQAAQGFTKEINTLKSDLSSAGHAGTPIYIGELGSVYGQLGIQGSSITQALFAGQILGEAMNDGVSRITWWVGFSGCVEPGDGGGENFSSSLYGWESFGGYMTFSDGTPEWSCPNAPTIPEGTLLPTARAFQLFSNVAKNGEHVLTASVTGDTTDVRAYSATNSGGTAVVLFNDNEYSNEPVSLVLSGLSSATSVSVETYDKAIYDHAQQNQWPGPTTTNLGAQSLPLTLTLQPWSMNVVIIH